MLKLSRIELAGFKSFYQRTKISFPDGITAVVGPNGCGKSNISDAISWALGEQSSKSLRGTKMQDVIFNGSAKRGPLPMAEVKLTLTWRGGPDKAGGDGRVPANGDGAGTPPSVTADPAGGNGAGTAHPEEAAAAHGNGAGVTGPEESAASPGNGAGGTGAAVDTPGAANGDQSRPIFHLPSEDGASVTVTRRLFRNGDSEYRINDRRCRLRDVQDLLQAASIGARTYAVIEQDRIHMLLSARPKERKELIEEAAGILGFKARRRSALLKLEATEANLARLRDVIAEVKRQVSSLKRQASKARRFQRNAEEIQKRRRILFHRENAELSAAMTDLSRQRDALQETLSGMEAAFAREEAAVEALRQRIDEEGHGAGQRRDDLHERQRRMDRLDGSLASLQERIAEAEAQARQREEEGADLQRRGREAGREAAETAARRETAAVELAETQAALDRLEQQYTGLLAAADEASRQAEADRDRVLLAVAQVSDARNRVTRLVERRARLERQQERLTRETASCRSDTGKLAEEVSAAHRRLEEMAVCLQEREKGCGNAADQCRAREKELEETRERLSRVRREFHVLEERRDALQALWRPDTEEVELPGEPAAAGVEVSAGWERAAGMGLGGLVRARLVSDLETALAALEAARDGRNGRIRLICPELVESAPRRDAHLSGRLSGEQAGLLAGAAGDPELVDDLRALVERWRARPGRAYLARTGESISPAGVLAGGGSTDEVRLLACNRQWREAAEEAEARAAELPALEEAERAALTALEQARSRLDAARRAREDGAQAVLEARLLHDRFAQERERVERRQSVLSEEEAVLSEEEAEFAREMEQATTELDRAETEQKGVSTAGEASRSRLDGLRQRIEVLAAERAELQSTGAARRESLRALDEVVSRLRAAAEDFGGQAVRRDEEVVALRERAARHRTQHQALGEDRENAAREITGLVERCRADEMTLQESKAALLQAERTARQAREAVDAARESLQAKELERARAAADVDHLEKECREQFGCGPAALGDALDEEERVVPAEQVRAELTRLEEIRDRIGPVNMMALEQFTEAEERQEFLLAQQSDLEESIRSLNATLEKIDRTSQERFLYALEQIRAEFQRIFTELFDGGRADIVLQDPDDVLESGIDIIAQPPGKRTQSINLLSGGEKALSAIALLFAIFNYRPSPFCLLDEVDAPLDESNVDRFARLLRNFGKETQFILITHNRRSMEMANAMYGITMSEPGVSQTVSMNLD